MNKEAVIKMLNSDNWVLDEQTFLNFAELSADCPRHGTSLMEYIDKHGDDNEKALVALYGWGRIIDEMVVRGMLDGWWHSEFY